MSSEWESDKNELLKILNVESPFIPQDSGILMNFLIDKNVFIPIDEPKNEREFVNLYATVISTLKNKGQNLPDYFDEPNICDDKTAIEILSFMNDYYMYETDCQIMILDNIRTQYVIGIVPKQYKDKIYTLSFQLGIPLVDIEDY